MKSIIYQTIIHIIISSSIIPCCCAQNDYTQYVNRFTGTGGNGAISPAAAVPFGMVQCGPNTRNYFSGYHYDDTEILGFSHINKSGGGCGDFLDVLFVPLNEYRWDDNNDLYPEQGFPTKFTHDNENATPGYYSVLFGNVKTEITTTSRCAFHKYSFNQLKRGYLAIDLHHGNQYACTIVPKDNLDTIVSSGIRVIDSTTVEGWRISSGWAAGQHVYFYAKFSKPIKKYFGFSKLRKNEREKEIQGKDIRAIFKFDFADCEDLLVKVGISPVSCEGARLNQEKELPDWNFEGTRSKAEALWNKELSKIEIRTKDPDKKEIFYTSLYNILLYPMLYSDEDGRFRGPDHKVHKANGFNYYAGVMGLWDTYRAAIPLLTLLRPDIVDEYIKTFLEHYKYFGQLPIWTLAGNETFQMSGIHSLPVITDAYLKGIRGYDVDKVYEAMKVSAMKDTIGYSMRYFVGLKNYKKYGYVPADLEMEATARTLEYAYDDWCMARMAQSLGKTEDYKYFLKRSKNYQNVFDKNVGFMNGRFSDGNFRRPFDPFYSSHRQDDFMEGNAWQWTFSVPHDINGLAELFGGKKKMSVKLDSLFAVSSVITGENTSGDISGLIGQYAHGNELSHHISYFYNYLGQPWKTQKLVNEILTGLYDNTPTGICGNEDTGQMSAWYVFSAMGFYPVDPISQHYDIGFPLFEEVIFHLDNGKRFIIKTGNQSKDNMYIQSARLNNEILMHPNIEYKDIMNGGVLELTMGCKPLKNWLK